MAKTYRIKKQKPAMPAVDYLNVLNDEQREVVTAGMNPLLVLAGAGTGKTRALTHRVVHLLRQGIPPENIILVTFTNRAAREMVNRVEELCGSLSRRLMSGTFHHIANRILRTHAPLLGYQENFTILVRDDAKEVMAAAMADVGIQPKKQRFPKPDLMQQLVSHTINTQKSIEEVVVEKAPRFLSHVSQISDVARAYVQRKVRMNLMDFDDLLMNLKVLLSEVPQVAKVLQSQTRAILVDEYQDTNKLQADIVDLLALQHRNITVVGDDAQSIYGFRGADVYNMLDFEKRYPDAVRLALTVNYRSSPQILALANQTLKFSEVGFQKELQPVKPEGVPSAVVPCRDVYQQAEFVVQRILELMDEGVSLSEVAILYRAHFHAMELQVELLRQGVPFVVHSGLRFFEQAHIRDVLAYLRLIYNSSDELSFRRAVKLHEGVGNATADQLWRELEQRRSSTTKQLQGNLVDALLSLAGRRAKKGVQRFVSVVGELAQPSMQKTPDEMIRVLLDSFYGDYLEQKFLNGNERRDDISQLADYAAGYDDLAAFMNELALVEEFAAEDPQGAEEKEDSLTLSTIHRAKGLEWNRVFIVWLAEGRFPSEMSFREPGGVEEERRLFYVATTRAREEVVMTFPMLHRQRDHAQVLLRRSRFVEEVEDLETEDESPIVETWLLEDDYESDTVDEVEGPATTTNLDDDQDGLQLEEGQ